MAFVLPPDQREFRADQYPVAQHAEVLQAICTEMGKQGGPWSLAGSWSYHHPADLLLLLSKPTQLRMPDKENTAHRLERSSLFASQCNVGLRVRTQPGADASLELRGVTILRDDAKTNLDIDCRGQVTLIQCMISGGGYCGLIVRNSRYVQLLQCLATVKWYDANYKATYGLNLVDCERALCVDCVTLGKHGLAVSGVYFGLLEVQGGVYNALAEATDSGLGIRTHPIIQRTILSGVRAEGIEVNNGSVDIRDCTVQRRVLRDPITGAWRGSPSIYLPMLQANAILPSDIAIINNRVTGGYTGINVNTVSSAYTCRDLVIAENTVANEHAELMPIGITVYGKPEFRTDRLHLYNNKVQRYKQGILVDQVTRAKRVMIPPIHGLDPDRLNASGPWNLKGLVV
jgi:hypothetical protein